MNQTTNPAYGKDQVSIIKNFSLWEYSEEVEKIIHEIKFFRKIKLGRRVAEEMSLLFHTEPELQNSDLIIPVPLHKSRRRQREYNQSEVLSLVISERSGIIEETGALKRVRQTKAQSKLNATQRMQNVKGAFKVVKPELIINKRIVLIDDVTTTGATLGGCTEVLLEAGAHEVMALTAARTLLK